LVAFIVGDFEYIEGKTKENVLVRIYTPLGKKDKGKFALSVATRALSYYTDFFGIAYPLPKMDLIAIPDFRYVAIWDTLLTLDSAGAMENWGEYQI
jgi:puromycin-sensitive aminopeptidase